jgi:carbamoyl-phosphate synthase large subunit
MAKRLLVTSAGTGPSNNLIRSLRAGDPSCVIIGCHDDQFLLRSSTADRRYLVPPAGRPAWARALRRIVRVEKVDLVIPATDADTVSLSSLRAGLRRRLFLPRPALVELCADKYRLTRQLRAIGLPAPATCRVGSLRDLDGIFRRLGGGRAPLWCRIRRGAGSRGAIPVANVAQARSWISYWRDMRKVPITAFTLSEYLPGRDLGCQSIWKDGRMILAKTYERLSYLTSGTQPAEVSSVPALTKTVREPQIVEVCARAIRALDGKASGVFGVDLKQDAEGTARITEINAGRFSSTTNLLDLTGKHNMTAVYVQLALGETVGLHDEYDVAEYHYLLRDIDAVPRIVREEEFFDGVEDARQLTTGRVKPATRREEPTC